VSFGEWPRRSGRCRSVSGLAGRDVVAPATASLLLPAGVSAGNRGVHRQDLREEPPAARLPAGDEHPEGCLRRRDAGHAVHRRRALEARLDDAGPDPGLRGGLPRLRLSGEPLLRLPGGEVHAVRVGASGRGTRPPGDRGRDERRLHGVRVHRRRALVPRRLGAAVGGDRNPRRCREQRGDVGSGAESETGTVGISGIRE